MMTPESLPGDLIGEIFFRPTIEKIQALLQRGVDINSVKMADGHTLLMTAAAPFQSDATLLKFLVAQGAEVNAQDIRGHSALLAAVVSRGAEKVEVLLRAGANPNIQDREGTTPLSMAAGRGYEPLVRLLLEAGADPDRADREGRTPLHRAAGADRVEIVRLLLDHGAHIDAMDFEGATPLARATQQQATGASGALRLAGADRAFDLGDKDPYAAAFAASMNALGHGCPGIFFCEGNSAWVRFIDEDTGLPVRDSGIISSRLTRCWVDGHNDGVREHIRLHGLPWNSRRPWMEEILRAGERPALHRTETLHLDAPPLVAPDGVTTLQLLQPSVTWLATQPLIVRSPKLWPEEAPERVRDFEPYELDPPPPGMPRPVLGRHWSAEARSRDVTHWGGKTWVTSVEVQWGPSGSELAIIHGGPVGRPPVPSEQRNHVLDLQLGLWLSSKPGGDWEARMKSWR